MKRLKYYLLKMENNTTTYKEMYDGKLHVLFPNHGTEIQYDPIYWHEGISCEITHTHKLAQSKPTLTLSIPIEKLGFDTVTSAAADYCLRSFMLSFFFLLEIVFFVEITGKSSGIDHCSHLHHCNLN